MNIDDMSIKPSTVPDLDAFAKLMRYEWVNHDLLSMVGFEVLARDKLTCRFCGFKSRSASKQGVKHGWMVPVCLNHPAYYALSVDKGITLCPFCVSYQALNWAVNTVFIKGQEQPAPGYLISLPQRDQVELNRLALYVSASISSRPIGGDQASDDGAASAIDSAMKARQSSLQTEIPIYVPGDDYSFARGIALLPDDLYEHRDKVFTGLRWWPNMQYWERQGIFWKRASY